MNKSGIRQIRLASNYFINMLIHLNINPKDILSGY